MGLVAKIGDGVKKKLEIRELYNWSKAGVDTKDKMLSRYITKRLMLRWRLAFFFNILDVTCLAAYILYYENNKVLPKNHINDDYFIGNWAERCELRLSKIVRIIHKSRGIVQLKCWSSYKSIRVTNSI